MVMTPETCRGKYASCGYHPEYNAFCMLARRSYGKCCGPCETPCYIVVCMHHAHCQAKNQTGTATAH